MISAETMMRRLRVSCSSAGGGDSSQNSSSSSSSKQEVEQQLQPTPSSVPAPSGASASAAQERADVPRPSESTDEAAAPEREEESVKVSNGGVTSDDADSAQSARGPGRIDGHATGEGTDFMTAALLELEEEDTGVATLAAPPLPPSGVNESTTVASANIDAEQAVDVEAAAPSDAARPATPPLAGAEPRAPKRVVLLPMAPSVSSASRTRHSASGGHVELRLLEHSVLKPTMERLARRTQLQYEAARETLLSKLPDAAMGSGGGGAVRGVAATRSCKSGARGSSRTSRTR